MPDDRAFPGRRTASALPRVLDLLRGVWDDFSLTELAALTTIAENEGVTVAGLARLCRLTDATASRTIRRLAPIEMPGALEPYRGLVLLRRGPTDNRSRHVFLTQEGRAVCRQIDAIIRDSGLPPLIAPTTDAALTDALVPGA